MSKHLPHHHFKQTSIESNSDTTYSADGLAYADLDNATSSTSEAPAPSPNPAGNRKRKPSRNKGSNQLARSASTPQLRDAAMSDDDKKRNKLGYQRISIACSHCRRRKIRCVISDGDSQQRCQNCIRLKKECVFYPVDQQALMENRGESAGRPVQPTEPPSIVSSSPSTQGLERSFETSHDFPPISTLPSNAPNHFQGLPLAPGSAFPGQSIYAPHDYPYRSDSEARPWPPSATISSTGSSSVSEATDGLATGYPRYSNAQGVGGDFAPFPGHDPMHYSQYQHHANNFAFGQQREGMMWQPLRTMSHGNIEHEPNAQRSYSVQMPANERSSNTAMHYAPSLDVQNLNDASHDAPHSAPVASHGPGFGPAPHYGFQHDPHNQALLRSPNYTPQWYPEQPGFGPLEEEPESYKTTHNQPG